MLEPFDNFIAEYKNRYENWKKNKWFCLVCGELNTSKDVKKIIKYPSGDKVYDVLCPKCKILHGIWSNFKQKKLISFFNKK